MSKRIKGIQVEIGGDVSPLNKALGDVNKTTRDLQSELRDVEKLLKFDPGNTELIAQKQQILSEAIANTSSKLETLKEAQEQVNAQFASGEISEEQYRAFQREVEATEQELQRLEQRLAETGATAQTFGQRMQAAGQSMQNLGQGMQDAGKSLSMNLTAPIVAAGGALLALAVNAGNTADRLLDLADITGMTTDSIQEWQYVANQAGVSTEAITTAAEGLIKRLPQIAKEGGPAYEAIETLGVSLLDASGNMRQADDIMDDLLYSLAEIEDPMQRNAAGAEIFGGAWKDLAPMLSMGAEGMEAARKEAHELGLVLDGDALQGANEFRKSMDNLKAVISGAANTMGAELAPVLNDTLIPLIKETLVPAISDFAKKVGEMVGKFGELSPTTQKVILGFITLLAALGPVLFVIGKIVSAVGGIMLFFSAAGPAATAFAATLKVLAAAKGVWAAITTGALLPALTAAATAVWTFTAALLANPITWIVLAIVGLIAAIVLLYKNWDEVSAFLLETWETIKAKAIEVWGSLSEFFLQTWENIKQIFSDAINGLINLFFEWHPLGIIISQWDEITAFFIETWENIKLIFFEALVAIGTWVLEKMAEYQTTIAGIWTAISEFFTGTWETIKQTAFNALVAIGTWVIEKFTEANNFIVDTWNTIALFFEHIWDEIKQIFVDMLIAIGEWVIEKFTEIKEGTIETWEAILEFFAELPERMMQAGIDLMQGLIDGIKSKMAELVGIVTGLGKRVVDVFKRTQESSSPSRVWARIGADLMKGLEIGITANVPDMSKKLKSMNLSAENFDFNLPSRAMQVASVGATSTNTANNSMTISGNTFNIREEADIEKVAKQLFNLQQRRGRGI